MAANVITSPDSPAKPRRRRILQATAAATPKIDAALSDRLTLLVARAGDAIKAIAAHPVDVRTKPDRTPVSAADEASHRLLVAGLAELLPGVPVVSEEQDHRDVAPRDGAFLLVDPLDGTREFIAGRNEFTVNVAIIQGRQPIAGFIAVPAFDLVYRGVPGYGAERIALDRRGGPPACGPRTAIRTRRALSGLVAARSRSHHDPDTEALFARWLVREQLIVGSAVKFCRVAEGEVDVYPRLGPTREWDIAAGQAIVVAAGGVVTTTNGGPLTYGQAERDYLVDGFVAWGDPTAVRPTG